MDPKTDHYGKYLALMKSYEDDLAELEAKVNQIPKEDFITEKDTERAIRDHFREEEALEKSLGRKYLTKIDP